MIWKIVAAALLLQAVPRSPVVVPDGMHAYSMPSQSMQPTIYEGEVFLADRRGDDCGSTQPALGDVVIIDRERTPYVKRVVAGPGQRVQMKAGVLIVDDIPVLQVEVGVQDMAFGLPATVIQETLPNGATYLTWDYGPDSQFDNFGPIIVPEASWFTLGDNRDNSIDGREFGPTPTSDLCGTAVRIVQSTDSKRVGMRP